MATDIEKLKASIAKIINKSNYNVDVLVELLDPLDKYIANPIFVEHLKQIVAIIIQDRDGNNSFTIDDVKLLGKDIGGITSLVSSILLVLGVLPEFKLKYDKGATEELIFKVLAYIFFVIIPKEAGISWTFAEKITVLDFIMSAYQFIMASKVTKDIMASIVKWFNTKGMCMCIAANTEEHRARIVDKHLPAVKVNLDYSVKCNKDNVKLRRDIKELKREMAKMTHTF